jgi:hypothetical protein
MAVRHRDGPDARNSGNKRASLAVVETKAVLTAKEINCEAWSCRAQQIGTVTLNDCPSTATQALPR